MFTPVPGWMKDHYLQLGSHWRASVAVVGNIAEAVKCVQSRLVNIYYEASYEMRNGAPIVFLDTRPPHVELLNPCWVTPFPSSLTNEEKYAFNIMVELAARSTPHQLGWLERSNTSEVLALVITLKGITKASNDLHITVVVLDRVCASNQLMDSMLWRAWDEFEAWGNPERWSEDPASEPRSGQVASDEWAAALNHSSLSSAQLYQEMLRASRGPSSTSPEGYSVTSWEASRPVDPVVQQAVAGNERSTPSDSTVTQPAATTYEYRKGSVWRLRALWRNSSEYTTHEPQNIAYAIWHKAGVYGGRFTA